MTAHDSYLGQFPWIHLTCAAVFLSPIRAVTLGGGDYATPAHARSLGGARRPS